MIFDQEIKSLVYFIENNNLNNEERDNAIKQLIRHLYINCQKVENQRRYTFYSTGGATEWEAMPVDHRVLINMQGKTV